MILNILLNVFASIVIVMIITEYIIKKKNGIKIREKLKKSEAKNLLILNFGYILSTIFITIFLKVGLDSLLLVTLVSIILLKINRRFGKIFVENFDIIIEKYFMIIFILISIVGEILKIILKK
ncbi:hypothetical protein [Sneathia sanguinegens]|uniref:hypothetical protein n=1 Tax=Sneathia sanguinegens TaxID=40543 RepID=UPI002582AC23|nr:hypothetical protein [Sneathia sanguinegens]MDU4652151.1 hypothetical protein [Sneathia sanguinegens]